MDLIRRRRISRHSWVALGLAGLAAAVAFTDVHSYQLSFAAGLSLLAYLVGYSGRFDIMSRHAKQGTRDRRYFVEEHLATPIILVGLLAVGALIDVGPAMHTLREGFTTFLTSPVALYAVAIGVCYEGLFVFTTLIFLDPREFSFCMPVHVCASLLAGVTATLGLRVAYGTAAPSSAQFIAAGCVMLSALALSYPAIRVRWRATVDRLTPSVLLFICGGNTARSPMAAAIGLAELATAGRPARRWRVGSAGVAVSEPGKHMAPAAVEALRQLQTPAHAHRSRQLTRRLAERSTAIYCMTAQQRDAVLTLSPAVAGRTFCVDPNGDLAEPSHDDMLAFALRLRPLVRGIMRDATGGLVPAYASGPAGNDS